MPWPITSYQKFQNRQGMDWGGYGKGFGGGGDLSDPMSTALGMFGMGGGGASSPAPSPWRMKLPAGQSLDSIGITPGQWQGGSFSTPTQMPTFQQGGSPLQMGTQPSSSAGMIRTAASIPSTSTDRSMPGGHTSAQPQQAFFNVQDMVPFQDGSTGPHATPQSSIGPASPPGYNYYKPSPYQLGRQSGPAPAPGYTPNSASLAVPHTNPLGGGVPQAEQQQAQAMDKSFQSAYDYQQAKQSARVANTPTAAQYGNVGVRENYVDPFVAMQNQSDTRAQQQRDIGARTQGGMQQNWLGNGATGQPGLQTDRGIPTTGQAQVRSYGTIPMYPEYSKLQQTPDDVARQTDVQTEMSRVANDRIENRARVAAGMPPKPVESYTPLNPDRPNVNSLPAAQYKMADGSTGSVLGRANARQAQADAKRWYMRNVFNYDRGQQRLNSPSGLMGQAAQYETDRQNRAYGHYTDSQQFQRSGWMGDRGPNYNPYGPSAAAANAAAQYGPMSPAGVQSQRYAGQHDIQRQAVISNYAQERGIPLEQAINEFNAFGPQGGQQPGGQQQHYNGPPPGVSPYQPNPQQQKPNGIPGINMNPQPVKPEVINQVLDQLPENATVADLQRYGITPDHLYEYLNGLDARDGGWLAYNNPANYTRRARAKRLLQPGGAQPQAPTQPATAAAYGYGTGL